MLLITALMFKVLWRYQQHCQRRFLQIEWQQQAWQLAYYSLEAACAQQGEAVHRPALPPGPWKRQWQRNPILTNWPTTDGHDQSIRCRASAAVCYLVPSTPSGDALLVN
jgi:hypothetical protein